MINTIALLKEKGDYVQITLTKMTKLVVQSKKRKSQVSKIKNIISFSRKKNIWIMSISIESIDL
jgi:hypothetical protein